MRSAVFVLMLAVCLVALQCTANAEDDNNQRDTDNDQPASSPTTTTAAQQALQTDQEVSRTDPAPLTLPEEPKVSETTTTTAAQTVLQSSPQQTLTGQQQPQPQPSQSSTSKGELQRQGGNGVGLQKKQDAALTSTPEDVTHTEHLVPQEKHTQPHTDQQDSHVPTQPHAAPPSTPFHSTKPGVQQTAQRPPTTTTNADKKLGEDTGSVTTHSEKTPRDHNTAQVQPPTSQDNKPVLQDTSNTPNKTTDKNPVSVTKRETLTPASTKNTKTQTNTTTEFKETHTGQESVTSTAEPAKKESTPSENSLQKLAKTIQPLDKTDSSIGSSSLCALFTLVTFIVMAVVPEF